RQLQSRGGGDHLHPPDRGCGKGAGRGDLHQSGPGGAPVLRGRDPGGEGHERGRPVPGGVQMLIKLMKHEFRATARIMGPLYLILLAVALGFNFSARLMDSSSFVLNMMAALIVMAYVIAVIAVFVVAFILMLQRFYKNLLGDEGYLMFTLPVSIHQHVWSKLIVSAVWFI